MSKVIYYYARYWVVLWAFKYYYYYVYTPIWPQPSGPSRYMFRSPSGASLVLPLLAYQRLAWLLVSNGCSLSNKLACEPELIQPTTPYPPPSKLGHSLLLCEKSLEV